MTVTELRTKLKKANRVKCRKHEIDAHYNDSRQGSWLLVATVPYFYIPQRVVESLRHFPKHACVTFEASKLTDDLGQDLVIRWNLQKSRGEYRIRMIPQHVLGPTVVL